MPPQFQSNYLTRTNPPPRPHRMETSKTTLECPGAPLLRTIPLPRVELEGSGPRPHLHRLIAQPGALPYDFTRSASFGVDEPVCEPALSSLSVLVSGAPAHWRIQATAKDAARGVTIAELLDAVHAMLQWPMSYAELSALCECFHRRSRIMRQCAARCAAEGEVYRGAESLRRVDWFEGRSRLRKVETVLERKGLLFIIVLEA
ncbi:hypothetical protein EXIGLDRAFT_124986 [Exidia glandulosa HHB12029]|uniref:DUF6699 domain-containing protein n=1 Tax=Exidia glandulosa HHB12029 TaxID=1314781 RepID=A0A166NJJ4_EXIGL|nr:hypothetical protein EXIGLDRAFT_477688 [Exidia glandulosa HHB12029]KZV90288.1 hypothetical protein EXIGLDRAFT_124986 [Exidia glandulosa HHB12029]